MQMHTWDSPKHDHAKMNQILSALGQALGFASVQITRLQRLFFTTQFCGALAMGFLLHSFLDVMLPTCHDDASALHQKLRNTFQTALQQSQVVQRPWMWGAGDGQASDGMPRDSDPFAQFSIGFGSTGGFSHACIGSEERLALLRSMGSQVGDDEMRFHLVELLKSPHDVARTQNLIFPGFAFLEPLLLATWSTVGQRMCETWCRQHKEAICQGHHVVTALVVHQHWIPIWIVPQNGQLVVHTLQDHVVSDDDLLPLCCCMQECLDFREFTIHRFPAAITHHEYCGAYAIAFIAQITTHAPMPVDLAQLKQLHTNLRAAFVEAIFKNQCCRCPVEWGSGQTGALTQALSAELSKHGVPADLVDQRSQQAIQAIGSEQIQNALKENNPWRALKLLGNNVRFKFILPNELSKLVAQNNGNAVGRKKEVSLQSAPPPAVALDPTKLLVMDGTFRSNGHQVPQISAKQIGPVACGIVLLSLAEAEPYLRSGKVVSTEPLAIGIFPSNGQEICTALPHKHVTIPCRCTVNQEPSLAEAVVVQIGTGFIDKHVACPAITLDPLDVVSVKLMVYRDEYIGDWGDFAHSPIKNLVQSLPILKRCSETNCMCPHWHNETDLPLREPIMDVWRRQFLKAGFRPAKAADATIFSVCIRVPSSLLPQLMALSGHSGIYTQPRTPDGRDVLADYVVVWASKLSLSELAHVKQTNPAAIGLARLGERRGLRTTAAQAAALHSILRPEATFLPQGPKLQFVAGPFPWGSDRQAIGRALKQSGWEVKALQPMQPIPGKGSMWLLQTVEDPPASILTTTHGEVVITKHKAQPHNAKAAKVHTVGAASTISLCGADAGTGSHEDPWLAQDPWRQYQPGRPLPAVTSASDGIQQLADRIQSEVLSKLPTMSPMEQDDVPDRLSTLETQVQHLMGQHKTMDQNLKDLTSQSAQQFATMQGQLSQQSQQLQGQIDGHCQNMQALMEHQMNQIRGLLSKRPRDDTNME